MTADEDDDGFPMNVEIELDENGVVLTRLTGEFDADEWIRQRDEAISRLPQGFSLDGRPMVTDAVDCYRPAVEWTTHVAKVCLYLETQSGYTGRRAYVVGSNENADDALSFFVDLEQDLRNAPGELKSFPDFDSAYAWATENRPVS